jgi:aspartyl-tRNA(Asn)/glutamyl-tRNA(Gln) amidotransferase subunit A
MHHDSTHGHDPRTDAGTIAPIAAAVRGGRVSAEAVLDEALARIDALDGRLHAFCTLDEAGARAAARAVDARVARGEPAGALAGVPVAIKDLVSTRGLRTTFGSRLYASHVPKEDDVVVERLRAAGAVIVGKTNTSEFGYGAFGHNALFETTRNPWNLERTSGGSSAGSAAAVAAGFVPLAIGSDGGGSVRVPAALCGVFGIKPSWGRIPVYPVAGTSATRASRAGSRSSTSARSRRRPSMRRLAMSVLAGPTPRDRASLPADVTDWTVRPPERLRGLRFAYSADLGHAVVDREIRAATADAAQRLAAALGAALEDAHPGTGDIGVPFEAIVALDTDRVGLRRMAREQGVALEGWLGRLLARDWTADEFSDAQMQRKRVVNRVWRFMERFDFLLTPTVASAAFGLGLEGPATIDASPVAPTAWLAYSALANFTGLPAASVPVGCTREGLADRLADHGPPPRRRRRPRRVEHARDALPAAIAAACARRSVARLIATADGRRACGRFHSTLRRSRRSAR